jgi:Nucleoside diphosphate kinase
MIETKSILLVKPEALDKTDCILRFLSGKGFSYETLRLFGGFRALLPLLYAGDLAIPAVLSLIDLYDRHNLGDQFAIIEVSCLGNAVARLHELKGHFRDYQHKYEDTLRGRYGLGAEFNAICCSTTLVLNGIHAPETEEELRLNRRIIGKVSMSYRLAERL